MELHEEDGGFQTSRNEGKKQGRISISGASPPEGDICKGLTGSKRRITKIKKKEQVLIF